MNNNLKITADEGYWFGLGAFETIWVYKNKAVFIEEHLDRLKNAVFYLNIVQEPIDQWIDKRKKEIEKYISENPMENGVLIHQEKTHILQNSTKKGLNLSIAI